VYFPDSCCVSKGYGDLSSCGYLSIAENCHLREANKALSKWCRAKTYLVCQGGALSIEDGLGHIAQKNVEERVDKHFKEVGQID
jgi:hypothetical protein